MGEFKTIDQILPTKKNQSPDDRAKDVEGVLNWMKTNNIPSVPGFDESEMPTGMDKLPSIPIKRRSPEHRQKDIDDITDWIRHGRPSNMDSPTNEFATIDQMLPTKKNQSPDDRAKDVESVLNWMRMNNIPSDPAYDETEMPLGMEKLPSIPVKRRSSEDRQKDVDDITDWIRQGRPSEIDSPTNEFKKIDQILPTKKNQSP